MTIRGDPLEQTEGLNAPVAISVSAHAMLLTSVSLWSAFNAPMHLGEAGTLAAGAVSVNIVQGVPLSSARSRIPNPVANPVEHSVPAVPSDRTRPPAQASEDDPNAVEVESKRKKRPPKPARTARKSKPPTRANQLSSSTGAAASSPIFTGPGADGSGGVAFGIGSPFGARFGWYAEALQRRLAEEWRKTLGQVSGRSRKSAVVSFRILRNGRIEDIRIAQTSANRSLDYSAFRAVHNIDPMQPLPPAMRRSSIRIEMYFQLTN
jgi:TonB family protein